MLSYLTRLFQASREWFEGKSAAPPPEYTEARIKYLQSTAEAEEAKTKEVEERLAYKRREREIVDRIQTTRAERLRLQADLGTYRRQRPRISIWVIVGGLALLFIILLLSMC